MRTDRRYHRRASGARTLVVLALVAAVAGCGGGGGGGEPAGQTQSAAAPSAKPAPEIVNGSAMAIRSFKFDPELLAVDRGQKITITNEDSAPHTITAADGSFDSGELEQGQSYTFAVSAPGMFTFICDLHQYMTGTLYVS